ncbi:MAG: ABC transporter ATP-binding protein [Candidatus Caldatribacterium sp.]|uniref:ABC transporter ATP-binding protein n=1 Tax=Candidatus Caldatribacterium sp. TaxID=2282143 RepID=UPI00299C8830|nr:ABC transporter ATP-binding protein [Candidatus Caldatribacterium sp.]MCX7731038.1 ABC transporter ATP-binding protein [Candidatus Caldatribacterium sp.]MDW8081990.1 ABC transporter ATP-binding protein [Candidatus Calescibacterium sp.]
MLRLDKVNKYFFRNTQDERWAIRNLNLEVAEGEFVTVVGSNGAGKTTLLNLIGGTCFPDSGRIFIDGHDVTMVPAYERAKYLGRVFQNTFQGTAPNLTIEENLAIAYLKGKRKGIRIAISEKMREYFRERLAEIGLGLENRLKDRVGLLSGGQRQALALLMATFGNPKILLLDEHTANLDPKTGEKIMELTTRLIEGNKLTAIMVTHNLRDALQYGDRTLMMDEGEIILDVSGKERERMTLQELLDRFSERRHKRFVDDRALLSS